ncbi:immune inhibitor A domain-containing protein [Pontibacillus sp. HMF3514]|uniref:immune inhibitor A domain-containing protein n=1 Tax=Pontibacillus sp. HMF3514 TaxID=2692425 RepID=UPI00131F946D|nr:immune inhibitor A domain-containing protein [Pontibacillus sp. HMF3514]QHE53568.1 M6 family metalloprotease domain-containing protein [Pontibacillus sp. HMF3514]
MKKRALISSALSLALAVGPVTASAAVPSPSDFGNSNVKKTHQHGGSPFDMAIANDERLIEMLKENGKISEDATPAEAQEALNKFLQQKQEAAEQDKGELNRDKEKLKDQLKKQMENNSLTNGDGNKLGQTDTPKSVKEEQYNGEVREDKVLALLIEYPDAPHGNISKEHTDMYYGNSDTAYSPEHYEDMLFGDGGWTGPDGKQYVSMKQYYEKQSGGSYTVTGEAAGWYQAEHPAAYYGANENGGDVNARELVREALKKAAQDSSVDLSEYDEWDRYDLDGDGNYLEADGLVDHLMVIHSGVGEEAGGGKLGEDAIWSHRWNLGGVTPIAGTEASVPYWGGTMAAYDYTIEPEDGAVGVFAHEFGHDLGLPDEYDTMYSGAGEPVSYWSIMASGSWAGAIPGTMPTGFSPYMKEMLQASVGGNWQTGSEVDLEDVNGEGMEFLLDEAATKGENNDVVKVNLPKKETVINEPYSGESEYFSGSDNYLHNKLTKTVDLSNAGNAQLTFQTWYDIEVDWDYAYVTVDGEPVHTEISTNTDPHGNNLGEGITGSSNGWKQVTVDLSDYTGEAVEVGFEYVTDAAVSNPGFFVDDISLYADGNQLVSDDAEGEAKFNLNGFEKSNGKKYTDHYYLLEWRSHNGVDEGLANIRRGASLMQYDAGLVVWYVDKKYDNNWTGVHPGEGFVGVVDADQNKLEWSNGLTASTRYQVHDAAFSLDKTEEMYLDYTELYGMSLKDNKTKRTALFDDSADYSNEGIEDAGRNVPNYGLKFRVTGESEDGTVGKVLIHK